jgi:hypothetical protein
MSICSKRLAALLGIFISVIGYYLFEEMLPTSSPKLSAIFALTGMVLFFGVLLSAYHPGMLRDIDEIKHGHGWRVLARSKRTFIILGILVALNLIPEPLHGKIAIGAGIGFLGLLVLGLILGLVMGAVRRMRRAPTSNSSHAEFAWQKSVEDRLDELERLKRRDMVTPEEYAAKRQEILKDL